ncbi:hypothetical protein N7475_002898 [Penicillium sp. IBT 31633x]|nr:hypothetical protein N7475_002898 [Penicillium sp. IBT 31633x]
MSTGLWGMKIAYSFAHNEASSISRRGLGQLKLRQSPKRTIRTICQTTVPSRSHFKLWKQDPIAISNGSTINAHRLATGAHYSTRRKMKSSTSRAPKKENAKLDRFIDNLLSDEVPKISTSHDLHDLQSGADVVRRAKDMFGGEDGESKPKFQAFAENPSFEEIHEDILRDIQSHKESLEKESQSSDTSQIGTMLLPVQDGLLPTINKDARTALEDAIHEVTWTEAYFKQQDVTEPQDSPRSARNAPLRRMSELLQSKHRAETCDDPVFKALTKHKMSLPVRCFSKQILDLIDSNTYSIIAANQRSGKSTQVPQIIFEDAIENFAGIDCNILCVQPTLETAKRLGKRVARERLEKIGDTVVYTGGLDPLAVGGTITYCAMLTLKSMCASGPSVLKQFSHIIIDDIHLSYNEINVVMMLLKQFVDQRKSIGAHVPKIIVMGAMIDIDFFGSYFGSKASGGTLIPAPHLAIPGQTFHVGKHYLEEVLSNLAHSLAPEILSSLSVHDDDYTRYSLEEHFEVYGQSGQIEAESQRLKGITHVPCGLISATILSLLSTTNTGSILVFVPGNMHYDVVREKVTTFGLKLGFDFSNKDQFRIINLQTDLLGKKADQIPKMPPGCRGIFVATCLAELSLTMPDVRYVIDSGKLYESRFASSLRFDKPHIRWISRDVALRRAECAGSVEAGDYYFLGSEKCFDTLQVSKPALFTLLDFPTACLHVKKASGMPTSISELLAKTPEPPDKRNINATIDFLKDLQALDEHGDLTALGHLISNLNMEPLAAKMVVLGIIFNCLDSMLILAALLGPKFLKRIPRSMGEGPWTSPRSSFRAIRSDHISSINAFWAIREKYRTEQEPVVVQFANSNLISLDEYHAANLEIDSFIRQLIKYRMIPAYDFGDKSSKSPFVDLNANSDDHTLISALLLHCLSPWLAVKPFGSLTVKIKSGMNVRKVPESSRYYSYILAYNFLVANEAGLPVAVRGVSTIDPLAACLLGNKVEQEGGVLTVDSWMRIRMQAMGAKEKEKELCENMAEMHKVLNEVSNFPSGVGPCAKALQALHTAFKILPFHFAGGTKIPDFPKMDFASYAQSRHNFFSKLRETVLNILHANETSTPHTELDYRGGKHESMDMDEIMDAEETA